MFPLNGGGRRPQQAMQFLGGGVQPSPQPGGQPMPPAQSVGDHLAEAIRVLAQQGFTPQNQSALEQFALTLQKMAGGQEQASPSPAPDSLGYTALSTQSAGSAPQVRGPRG